MGSAVDMRDRPVREHPQFRRLVEGCRWRSEEEDVEVAKLKKLKLALKDEMESMLLRTGP